MKLISNALYLKSWQKRKKDQMTSFQCCRNYEINLKSHQQKLFHSFKHVLGKPINTPSRINSKFKIMNQKYGLSLDRWNIKCYYEFVLRPRHRNQKINFVHLIFHLLWLSLYYRLCSYHCEWLQKWNREKLRQKFNHRYWRCWW